MQKLIEDYIWHLSRCAVSADDKFVQRQEKRMEKKLSKIFAEQEKWLVNKLKSFSRLSKNSIQTNDLDDDVDDLLSGMPGQKPLTTTIVFYSELGISRGGRRSMTDYALRKFGISFSVKHPEAVKYLKEKRVLELSNSKGTITATTKDRIKEIITDGVATGKSYQQVAQQIQQQGEAGVFSPARSKMIAVNEMGHAYEEGRKIPLQDFREKYPERNVKKWWMTRNDDRVTVECNDNQSASEDDGLDFDESFPSGDLEAPRTSNPRCRCTMRYKII